MTGISGTPIATTWYLMPRRESTPTHTTWERKIWTRMAPGRRFRTTVKSGGLMWALTGRRTVMDAGFMNFIGAGPGFRPIPGDGRRTTTAAGWSSTVAG